MINSMQALRSSISLLLLLPAFASAAVYMTPKEALKQFFLSSDTVKADEKKLDKTALKQLEKTLGYKPSKDHYTFYIGRSGERIDGYAILDHQIGKTQPITFMTLINPAGQIEQVEILAYQESHGSEVRQGRFLKQYQGKDLSDPLRVSRDIKNISGATLSARAVTTGVKRALVLWQYFYGGKSK